MIGSLYNVRMNRLNSVGSETNRSWAEVKREKERKLQLELKNLPVKDWKEVLHSRWGAGKPHEVFKVGHKRFFFMLNDDNNIVGYLKTDNTGPSFRTVKKHHILHDHPDSFVHMITITDKHLDINVTKVKMKDQYYEKRWSRDAHKRWVKVEPHVILTYEHTGSPNIFNGILHRLSFSIYFRLQGKKVILHLPRTGKQESLFYPDRFELKLGEWIRIPLDNKKEIDIISMRGQYLSLPNPHGKEIADWRVPTNGFMIKDPYYNNVFWLQHKCKNRRVFGKALPYSIQNMLRLGKSFVFPKEYTDITHAECWDCGTIVSKEFLDNLFTASGIKNGF